MPGGGATAYAAGGAYAVDDVDVDEVGACKVDAWTAWASNRDSLTAVAPACVVDFGRRVEVGVQADHVREGSSRGTFLALKAKTNVIESGVGRFGLAITGAVVANATEGRLAGAFVNVPVTFKASEALRFNVNTGWVGTFEQSQNHLFVGAGVEWDFAEKLTAIGEIFAFVGPGPDRPRAQAGLRYNPTDKVTVDLIYGRNVLGDRANWVTIGLTLRR